MTRAGRSFVAAALPALLLVVVASCSDDEPDAGDQDVGASPSTDASATTSTTTPPLAAAATTTQPVSASVSITEPTTEGTTTTLAVGPSTATQPPGSAPASCGPLAVGVTATTLTAGGAEHPVRIFVPSTLSGSRLPVVLDWHGLGSDGVQQAMFSGYEEVAEAEGFIVVHPTGVADTAGGPNSWQLFPATTPGERDDVAFAHALIDELIAGWCADPTRIYSTGMSNGGFFTARLICEMPARIAAAVSVAGLFHAPSCEPTRTVPYMGIHGTDDEIVPFDGDGESPLLTPDAPDSVRVFFTQVIPGEFAEFAATAGCDPAPAESAIGDEVIRYAYGGCSDGVPLDFYEVVGGGHTWPGSPMAEAVSGALGHTTDDIDATRDGWRFMSQFTLDR